MNFRRLTLLIAGSMLMLNASACKKEEAVKAEDKAAAPVEAAADGAVKAEVALDQLDRNDFNHAALRLNLPLFWVYEAKANKTVRPEVLTTLNFYPTSDSLKWKDADGKFTQEFYDAYQKMVDVMKDPSFGAELDDKEKARRAKVAEELDQAAITVVESDFTKSDDAEKKFIAAMLKVGKSIDAIYSRQVGLDVAMAKIAKDDILSQSMARRNWGVDPESPKMKDDKACRAIAGDEKIPVGVYPVALQSDADFCNKLAARPDAETLLTPFTVVTGEGDELKAVPYTEHFKAEMTAVSDALKEAAAALEGNEKEAALVKYLKAAADSFLSNDWEPANEAWAAMNSTNSSWYVRVAPDETYWEPCSRKAGFHLTFARINPDALAWQEKLTPLQQDMEEKLAAIAGAPYKARKVSFHLPDFIDIVTNSGDDRDAFGATIGQSLPNWGPVANEGRGRTVVMSNLYTDPDSLRDRKTLASSMFTEKDLSLLEDAQGPGLLGTIIHEAAHNLGPAHEYQVDGKIDDAIFGGAHATLAEEFKAQTCALWFLPYLVEKGVISQDLANKSYADSVHWAFGHISRGMTTGEGRIQPYSQLAAIQLGMMLEDGAVTFEPETMAANGKDKGAFVIHMEKMPASVERIMSSIAQIKAKGDKDGLLKLQKQHVEGTAIPFDLIKERMLRLPKTSFVYSVKL
ncbi:MAG: hypothetical protein J6S69_10055 [Proteobacteria bacterium]|nr:hypothetical protein [Pseudomonadota bacterium]